MPTLIAERKLALEFVEFRCPGCGAELDVELDLLVGWMRIECGNCGAGFGLQLRRRTEGEQ